MVVAVPADIEDIPGTAQILADDLGLDVDDVTGQLEAGGTEVVLAGWLDSASLTKVRGHVTDGTLAGVSVDQRPVMAVSTARASRSWMPRRLSSLTELAMDAGATGMAWADNAPDWRACTCASGADAAQPLHRQDGTPAQGHDRDAG